MKLNVKTLKLFATLLLIGCFFSCEYNVEEDLTVIENPDPDPDDGSNGGGNTDPCATITFSVNVKPIIDSRCVQCHNGNRFPDLRTFENVKNNANLVKSEVASRSMPQGSSLTQAQIDAIVCWVDNGTPNN